MTEQRAIWPLRLSVALKLCSAWFALACLSSAAAPPAEPQVPAAAASASWQKLSPVQKQALAPLGAQWAALTAQQQRKWLAISTHFAQLSPADQRTMHARMADWVALSPQQRHWARLNFNTLQSLPNEDKKTKWTAYQALSEEEKRALSSSNKALPKNAAPTAKPLAPQRQVQAPGKALSGHAPAIAIDRNTLLPRPAALTAPIAPRPPQTAAPDAARTATETSPS